MGILFPLRSTFNAESVLILRCNFSNASQCIQMKWAWVSAPKYPTNSQTKPFRVIWMNLFPCSMRNSNSMIDESKAGTRRLIESFNVFINYSNRHKPLKSELPLTEILLNIQHEIPFTMNGNTWVNIQWILLFSAFCSYYEENAIDFFFCSKWIDLHIANDYSVDVKRHVPRP